jgi:hypothetical protein
VKRAAETPAPKRSLFSAVRFTDLPFALAYPSSELLGCYQSSAKRRLAEIVFMEFSVISEKEWSL